MRIVVDYRPALRGRTGVGHYVFNLVQGLLARHALVDAGAMGGVARDDITLFSSSWKDRPLAEDLRQLEGARIVDRRLPVKALNLLWHRLERPSIEQLTGREFDVAVSPHPLLLPSRRAAQVVTIYDLDFLHHPERAVREIRRDYSELVREHAHRAEHVVVCSHYTAREVETHLGLSPDRITVCYPGAPDWPPPLANRPRHHILFVGTLERRKNVGTLLDAYRCLLDRKPDTLPLVLAGGARDEAAEWLERIRQPPLAGRVRYVGYVSDEQRRELFETAAVFVLPSLEEGFGMPAVEAMTAGVPVVVSRCGALPEVVGDAGAVVEPDDVDGLAGAIERLLSDEGIAAASAARGVQRARHFTWASTAASAWTAFERAIEHKRGGRR